MPKILYAHSEKIHIIKLKGELSYLESASLESFVSNLLSQPDKDPILLDLSEVIKIDSTILGIIAGIGIRSIEEQRSKASIFVKDEDLERTILTMGFDNYFIILHAEKKAKFYEAELCEIKEEDAILARRLLKAHDALITMYAQNKKIFRDVIKALHKEITRKSKDS